MRLILVMLILVMRFLLDSYEFHEAIAGFNINWRLGLVSFNFIIGFISSVLANTGIHRGPP